MGLASPDPTLSNLAPSEEPIINVPDEFDQLRICGIDQVHSRLTKDLTTQPVGDCQGHNDQDEGGEAEEGCQPIPHLFEPSRHSSGCCSPPGAQVAADAGVLDMFQMGSNSQLIQTQHFHLASTRTLVLSVSQPLLSVFTTPRPEVSTEASWPNECRGVCY